MFNTIILKKGEERLTKNEYKRFSKGDTIFGNDSTPEEIKRWNIRDKEDAEKELSKYSCEYIENPNYWSIKEWALEYCKCNEDGEFIQGSDYDFA